MSDVASFRVPLCIAPSHPSLPGHFPGQPVVPGVVILDAVQQAIEAAVGALPALDLPQAFTAADVLRAMHGHVLAEASTYGSYSLNR